MVIFQACQIESFAMTHYPNIFQPLELRHRQLDNRIVFGAHTANMSEMGLPGERHRGYYEERARGGVAMIVVEPVPVHATGVLTRGNFRHGDDSIIEPFRRITDAITMFENGGGGHLDLMTAQYVWGAG